MIHLRKNDDGQPVTIYAPSTPSALEAWGRPDGVAVVVPGGPVPGSIGGVPFASWVDVLRGGAGWSALAGKVIIKEPDFDPPAGLKRAAGAVVLEPDGRVWLVAPTNGYAGYKATFAKGTVEPGISLQATALRECFEESGLQIEILAHLIDVPRSQSYTRYYLARRIGGSPADAGWESQAVMLVPFQALSKFLNNPNDGPIIAALQSRLEA